MKLSKVVTQGSYQVSPPGRLAVDPQGQVVLEGSRDGRNKKGASFLMSDFFH